MKNEKMSLENIEGKLNRKEMKEIMAGYVKPGTCTVHVDCSNNGWIECSGTVCDKGTSWVSCDGTKTDC